jgi:hypothetical protein
MIVKQQIKSVALATLMEAEGIILRKHGSRYVCLCPFHDDQNPSMTVFADNHAHCYGCGWHGDAVDFVRDRHGFDFNQALLFLGITRGPMTGQMRKKNETAKRKAQQRADREQRIRDLVFTLGILIRAIRKATNHLTFDNFNDYCEILEPLSWWENCHDVLCCGDDDAKNKCLEALKDFMTISQKPLFKTGFGVSRWLRSSEIASFK